MSEFGLTKEERSCLQFWFRQALAEVERRELCNKLLSRDLEVEEEYTNTHHFETNSRRPAHRAPAKTSHHKDLVSV